MTTSLKETTVTQHGFRDLGKLDFAFRRHNARLEIEIGEIREKLPAPTNKNPGWLIAYVLAHAMEHLGPFVFADLKRSKSGLREEAANMIAELSVSDAMILLWKRVSEKTRGMFHLEGVACPCGRAIEKVSLGDMPVIEPVLDAMVEVEDEVVIGGKKTHKVALTVPSFREVFCLMTQAELSNSAARVFRAVEASSAIDHESLLDIHSADLLLLAKAVDRLSGGPQSQIAVECPDCCREVLVPVGWEDGGFF